MLHGLFLKRKNVKITIAYHISMILLIIESTASKKHKFMQVFHYNVKTYLLFVCIIFSSSIIYQSKCFGCFGEYK